MACCFLAFVDLHLGENPLLAPKVNAEEPMGYVKLKTLSYFSLTTNIIK